VSATALRPTPVGPLPAPTPAPEPRTADARDPGRGDLGLWIRLAACGALAVFGAQAWGEMVRPEDPGRVVAAAGAGVVLGALALLSPFRSRAARAVVLTTLAILGALGAILLAGVPVRLLDPEFWGDLTSGLGQGISALPGLSVPYRGVDEWNRIAMLLGGTALAILGPLLACWPARDRRRTAPFVPAVVLAVLYAVPAVQLRAGHPFLDGTAFALLLAAVLFAERLGRRDVPVALTAVAVTALAGLALAPRLDRPEPWLDYESIAQSLGERGTTVFDWNHGYGPLDWPRDGREVLRIRAKRSSYWKATTLADFDGVRWREVSGRGGGLANDPEADGPNPRWVQELRVRVRNMRTRQFVSAGTTVRIARSPRTVLRGAPGSYVTSERPLRRGHAYIARAYVPRPTASQMISASSDYPETIAPYLSMQLPIRVGGPTTIDPTTMTPSRTAPPAFVLFAPWGDTDRRPIGYANRGSGDRASAGGWLDRSRYGRTWRLAQRLRAQSDSPYDYVRRIQDYLREDFVYTETPPRRAVPLDGFLFDDKRGYCQQFSGAMALLLRMGGVPARIASGFTPGTLDPDKGEYVVRDIDAHSWVEAYFPSYGWVTFDPTPAIAPPRAQAAGTDSPAEEDEEEESGPAPRGDRQSDAAAIDSGTADTASEGPPVVALTLGGLGVALAAAAAVVIVRRRRRHATLGPDAAVAELERALRRSGRRPAGGLTLRRLEESLRSAPDAAEYVRSVRSARYGFGARAPSRHQRRALRRELSSGLGLRGRVRGFWALPPF
jgi:protein-glutamine gamma-glutamyltransferase